MLNAQHSVKQWEQVIHDGITQDVVSVLIRE